MNITDITNEYVLLKVKESSLKKRVKKLNETLKAWFKESGKDHTAAEAGQVFYSYNPKVDFNRDKLKSILQEKELLQHCIKEEIDLTKVDALVSAGIITEEDLSPALEDAGGQEKLTYNKN